jgi:hypothetical protein
MCIDGGDFLHKDARSPVSRELPRSKLARTRVFKTAFVAEQFRKHAWGLKQSFRSSISVLPANLGGWSGLTRLWSSEEHLPVS